MNTHQVHFTLPYGECTHTAFYLILKYDVDGPMMVIDHQSM